MGPLYARLLQGPIRAATQGSLLKPVGAKAGHRLPALFKLTKSGRNSCAVWQVSIQIYPNYEHIYTVNHCKSPMSYNVSTNHPSCSKFSHINPIIHIQDPRYVCPSKSRSASLRFKSQRMSLTEQKDGEILGHARGCIPFRPSLGFCMHFGPRPNQS